MGVSEQKKAQNQENKIHTKKSEGEKPKDRKKNFIDWGDKRMIPLKNQKKNPEKSQDQAKKLNQIQKNKQKQKKNRAEKQDLWIGLNNDCGDQGGEAGERLRAGWNSSGDMNKLGRRLKRRALISSRIAQKSENSLKTKKNMNLKK